MLFLSATFPSSNLFGGGSLNPCGGGPEGVAYLVLEVWNCEDVARSKVEGLGACRTTADVANGLAARRDAGRRTAAIVTTGKMAIEGESGGAGQKEKCLERR